jgi:hypothetical protein
MQVVRDRPAAKWLPSRHRFALAQLIAFIVLWWRGRAAAPFPSASDAQRNPSLMGPPEHIVLALDRDQSAIEQYSVALWYLVSVTCFTAALLPLPVPTALAAACVIIAVAFHIPMVISGTLIGPIRRWLRPEASADNHHYLAILYMTPALLASLYFAVSHSWARWIAWIFLGLVCVNAVARVIFWMLRERVRAAEQRCVS